MKKWKKKARKIDHDLAVHMFMALEQAIRRPQYVTTEVDRKNAINWALGLFAEPPTQEKLKQITLNFYLTTIKKLKILHKDSMGRLHKKVYRHLRR